MVALELASNAEAERYCKDLANAGLKAGVEATAVESWMRDLSELDPDGAFFLAVPWIYVLASK